MTVLEVVLRAVLRTAAGVAGAAVAELLGRALVGLHGAGDDSVEHGVQALALLGV